MPPLIVAEIWRWVDPLRQIWIVLEDFADGIYMPALPARSIQSVYMTFMYISVPLNHLNLMRVLKKNYTYQFFFFIHVFNYLDFWGLQVNRLTTVLKVTLNFQVFYLIS